MPLGKTYQPEPAFLTLGQGFADSVEAANFRETTLRYRNDRAAATIGLDDLTDEEWITNFGRFEPLPGNLMDPLAQRYHGHQFRHYNPDIGDGRGFLFAQMRDNQNRLMDLGTKGSGTTPYSRSGDGRLTLKGGVREILATEMLEALGANTSKTFSIIETGESLHRGDEPSPTRSAVMVRLNHGHIRIGTFQRLAFFSETERISKLVDYCLTHYFAVEPKGAPAERALRFLGLVSEQAAANAADLMASGFVHGVLNTDNINVTGEIFDFGPWRFLPKLDPNFTAAYFDETGLYAFGRQPEALHWNIYQLGGALADIAGEAPLKEVLTDFPAHYITATRNRLLKRLGVIPKGEKPDDAMLALVNGFMADEKFPYEQFFFDWHGGGASEKRAQRSPEAKRYKQKNATEMVAALKSYEPLDASALETEYLQSDTPCTMLIDEVEAIWTHIAERDDWGPFHEKLASIRQMGTALKAG